MACQKLVDSRSSQKQSTEQVYIPKRSSNRPRLGGVKFFWRQHTVENFQLHTPLGAWISTTHRRWILFYEEKTNCPKKKNGSNADFYVPTGNTRTRSGSHYIKMGSGPEELSGRPASVQVLEGAGVKLRYAGPPLTAKPEDPTDFWEYLTRQGGTWMWEGLSDKHKHDDLTWLVEGLKKGTIEWCTDGSYHRGRAPNIIGVGWMCCDTTPVEPGESRKTLKGNFWEKSDSADSYRAEQLGICAIHHLITALTSYYNIGNCKCKIWCDNMGTVNISKKQRRRIRPGASCVDILRNNTIQYNTIQYNLEN